MRKTGFAGMVVKAAIGGVVALVMASSMAFADNRIAFGQYRPVVGSEAVMSLAHMMRLKSVLKLTVEQEPLWAVVEQTFREISQAQESRAREGLVQGIKHRITAIGLNTLALRRLASAAYPLIRTLTEEQKQNALNFARSAGLESVAAAF